MKIKRDLFIGETKNNPIPICYKSRRPKAREWNSRDEFHFGGSPERWNFDRPNGKSLFPQRAPLEGAPTDRDARHSCTIYATCVTERVSNLITRRAAVKLRKYSSWAARAPEALRWPLAAGWRKRHESSRRMKYSARARSSQAH